MEPHSHYFQNVFITHICITWNIYLICVKYCPIKIMWIDGTNFTIHLHIAFKCSCMIIIIISCVVNIIFIGVLCFVIKMHIVALFATIVARSESLHQDGLSALF